MFRSPSPLSRVTWPCFVFLLFAPYSFTQEPFEPEVIDPLREAWRWQNLEGIGQSNRLLSVGEDGAVWVVKIPNELYRYNGHRTELIYQPQEPIGRILDMVALPEKQLLLLEPEGVSKIINDKKFTIWSFAEPIGWGEMAVAGPDRFWVGTDLGIFEYFDGKKILHRYPTTLTTGIRSLCYAPGDAIYFVSTPTSHVIRGPLIGGELSAGSEWETILIPDEPRVNAAELLAASDGRIWYINTNEYDGVLTFRPDKHEWERHDLRSMGGENFNTSLMQSLDGDIWVVGRGSLQVFNGQDWRIFKAPDLPIPDSKPQLSQDPLGNVYVLEEGAGVDMIDYGQRQYRSLNHLHFQAEARDGSLWYIHVDGGIVREIPLENRWLRYPSDQTGVANPVVLKVLENGDILCAGATREMAAYSIFDGQRWKSRTLPGFARSFSYMGVKQLSDGRIFMGSGQNLVEYPNIQGGAILLNLVGGEYTMEYLSAEKIPARPWCVGEDPIHGDLYMSGHGLARYSMDGNTAEILDPEIAWIDNIAVTGKAELWMAVWGRGIYRSKDGKVEDMTDLDLFPERHASFVFAGNHEFPVLATDEGIFRFDGDGWHPFLGESFSIYRGSGTIKQSGTGKLWFNTTHTDWYYRGLRSEPYPELKKAHFKTVQYIPDVHAPETEMDPGVATLFSEGPVTLRWTGTDFQSKTLREDLSYSYRINGGNWSPFTRSNRLELPKFKGGLHQLEVRARDSDFNIEPEPLSFSFRVILPVWKQPWFIATALVSVFIFVGLLFLIFSQRLRHILELERVKLHFFSNISHELRTPLTLVQGPIEKLLETPEVGGDEQRSLLRTAKQNISRLTHLVDQLLEFRRVEGGHLCSQPRRTELVGLVKNLIDSFEFTIREHQQEVSLRAPFKSCHFSLDEDLYFKILNNLLYNASKYGGQHGKIEIHLEISEEAPRKNRSTQYLKIVVADNGKGIDPQLLPHVFEPFYRGSEKSGYVREGVGIGLALVKEHVEYLGGRIKVQSPRPGLGNGTAFEVDLPIENPELEREDPTMVYALTSDIAIGDEAAQKAQLEAENSDQDERPHLHLVEDNMSLREFLQRELSHDYRVTVSGDGLSAVSVILKQIPDVVITDVMLPEQSGFELCRQLKADPISSHIPVIILTAFKTQFHEEKGLEMGADDFISKPVSVKILKLKISNLLTTRKRLQETLRHQYGLIQPVDAIPALDKEFLEKADQVAEEHLSEEGFGVEPFAKAMKMSRSNFSKKFKDITGMSPAAFIKVKRLNKAARMIAEGSGNITDIAFDVGFSEVSYFSRCFKEHFNCVPSRYRETVAERNDHRPILDSILDRSAQRGVDLN